MATLTNGLSGQSLLLRSHHVFGRDASRCDTVIGDAHVSRVHAHIRWKGGRWELHDHSSNGTLVSGVRVGDGEYVVIRAGDQIDFGGAAGAGWMVRELADPGDTLWPVRGGAQAIVLRGPLVLPGGVAPGVAVSRTESGDWRCETGGISRALRDGDEIVSGVFAWRLVLARRDTTAQLPAAAALEPQQHVVFRLSLDEEHVHTTWHVRGGTIDLGERMHHYCLVTLARQRHADGMAGHEAAAQGWLALPTLARMLGLSEQHVNVQIHRARAQYARLAGPDAAPLVERRRGSVRFGPLAFSVYRGDSLECQSGPAPRPAAADPPPPSPDIVTDR